MEFCSYKAPPSITGSARVFSVNTHHMADCGCWFRITILGRCFEVWGPEPPH
jgi:hypothetical protein